ncbi:MAG: single-strand DNA-binding protein [Frankiales bacterium]|jgi:single-strand DNA-binding protein|nr:single-strand DNA-binding protein [Frankiales bacterium]
MSAAIAEDPDYEHCNEVHLVGRVGAAPTESVMPSGDVVLSLRLVVDRPAADRRSRRTSVDTLDCSAWKAGVRRSVSTWNAGDIVEIDGVLRRRFFRAANGGSASRYDVEARSVRRLARGG